MDNLRSFGCVGRSRFSTRFVKPLYGSYCFSRIPATVPGLFSGEAQPGALPGDVFEGLPARYSGVACVLIDGFGWELFERYTTRKAQPFLRRLRDQGVASKLTSMFPSTTANHLYRLHGGLPVTESGVVEWIYFDPGVGRLINPLKFSLACDSDRETLARAGWEAGRIVPRGVFYPELRAQGIRAHLFMHEEYCDSTFNRQACHGATLHGWKDLVDGLRGMAELMLSEREGLYAHFYYGGIDQAAHEYGAESEQVDRQVCAFLDALERSFFSLVEGRARGELLLMVCADHGVISVDPSRVFYLDREVPEVVALLRKGIDGEPLAPAGSAPDFLLYVREGHIEEVQELVGRAFAGRGEVWKVDDLLRAGLFGPVAPSKTFLDRIGDLIVLGEPGVATCWWNRSQEKSGPTAGIHGGLNRAEMEIPFLAIPL